MVEKLVVVFYKTGQHRVLVVGVKGLEEVHNVL